eukprot:1180502-Ditylum_brightwellii.AAC.1
MKNHRKDQQDRNYNINDPLLQEPSHSDQTSRQIGTGRNFAVAMEQQQEQILSKQVCWAF